ncbi:ribose-5-phosphate isomerase [Candidatus Roizmanbacteria bacterium CG11_big_fil_rev_8_21_14_0_20_37_16]|uniref:Ribose-5-phosphate isomerase n=2 Tax=Candidatus Roizmaniibacteriota TaxID=1752723 RepID=A0A2H0KK24_9BACT|nr:MAG: ribose-5-phosphate isomerase [Candidatus Roizmanbacteria bacterium CG11_big_fil_rev_8_21_14_0_20_37_16]PIV08023.1 MAG: ribose-5-phosphate isomerase [Candidatus Roizmanbacteria bacterium CG03_land_8_20_14_0_80_39_12]
MPVFIATDHRGFELKNKLVEYLQEKDIRVEDFGNYQFDSLDDNPDFAQKVAQAVQQNPQENLGVVICGSGIGVSISVNRFKQIRCGIALNADQVKHGRENDHTNILAIASDYTDLETAKKYVDIFLSSHPKQDDKYIRRGKKFDIIPVQ